MRIYRPTSYQLRWAAIRRVVSQGTYDHMRNMEEAYQRANFHTVPTIGKINQMRRRRMFHNYLAPWDEDQDNWLAALIRRKTSLKKVCKLMGRNPNGIVLRCVAIDITPKFAGKVYKGRFYEEVLNKHMGWIE